MALASLVEDLAKAAVLTDADDLSGLVSLQDRFRALVAESELAALESLAAAATRANELIDEVILRQVEDANAALELVGEIIDYAQETAAAIEAGTAPGEIRARSFDGEGSGEEFDPADDIDPELLAAWISGCDHTLSELEGEVVAVESADDPDELLAEIRRTIHTLKGECGVLSLHGAQKLCHEAESAIDRCIDRGEPFPVDAILSLIDWMKSYVSLLANDPRAPVPPHEEILVLLGVPAEPKAPDGASEPAAAVEQSGTEAASDNTPVEFPADLGMEENLGEFLGEAREHLTNSEEALLALEQDFGDLELINTVFRSFHTIKGVAGFMNLQPIVEVAHKAESLLDKARNGDLTLNSAYLDLILASNDMLTRLIGTLEGAPAPTRGELTALATRLVSATQGELGEAAVKQVLQAKKEADQRRGELLGAGSCTRPAAPQAAAADPGTGAAEPKSSAVGLKRVDQTVKVSTQRMDSLVTMVGELVIAQQMVVQDPCIQNLKEQRIQRNLTHTGKIIRDLQEVAMALRMVTLKGTFQKMARLVRDLAAKNGKKITLRVEGEDTELDRNVVDQIGDPLVHMIRNSCDHGLEPPEERLAAGKPETGVLTLRAYHQGGSIVIEIEDDGRGLPRDKILKKAIERGIYTPDRELDKIPDSEVYNLVFLPGFSTAEKVTDISGRGVGMDVVRRNIQALRGKTEIRSAPGKGSTFAMRLPLTMAIIDGMIVRLGSQRYVIPTLSIEQSFQPTRDQISSVIGQGEVVSVRGSLLPIYRLSQIVNLDEGIDDPCESLLIVLESNDLRCCLLVDEIIGQQQVVIKSLGEGVESIRGVSGGAILGDGRVALILDVGGLIKEATSTETMRIAA